MSNSGSRKKVLLTIAAILVVVLIVLAGVIGCQPPEVVHAGFTPTPTPVMTVGPLGTPGPMEPRVWLPLVVKGE